MANRHPKQGDFHPHDRDLMEHTFYLSKQPLLKFLTLNLSFLLRYPKNYLTCIRLAFALREGRMTRVVENLKHLVGAVLIAEHIQANQVNHVHVHFAFGAASVAIFMNALTGMPYSLAIHGSDVLLPQPLTEEKIRRAKFIVSNCRFHIKSLRDRFPALSQQKFYVVRLGVALRSGIWSRVKPPENDPELRILNVARLEAVKAQHVLIAACAALRDMGISFRCRLVGEGPKREELQKLIDSLRLQGHVELLGTRYEADVSDLYDWSHVVVLSSVSEGTPMTIIEAMAKARPVIASRITALPEMVIDGRTGFLFEPGSVNDLTSRLAHLAHHPSLITEMGNRGYRRARSFFDIETNIQELIRILAGEIPIHNCTGRVTESE